MTQTVNSIRVISLIASVAVHAMVLATVPDIIGETGNGPAENSSSLHVSILRSEPADDVPKVNPDLGKLEQESEQAKPSPDFLKSHSTSTKQLVEQRPKATSAPNISSSRPASDKRGADTKEKRPMQVAASGQTTHLSRDYQSKLIRLIERHKYYPLHARRKGLEGTSTVSFTVSSNGDIAGVSLARSSGTRLLDQAAILTIKRMGKAPPFPVGIDRSKWKFVIPLAYNIQ